MSVINKMLQELERRQSGTVSQGSIGSAVRISAAPAPSRAGRRILIGLLLVVTAGAVWYGTVWVGKKSLAGGVIPAAPASPVAPAAPVAATAPGVAAPSATAQASATTAAAPVASVAPVASAPAPHPAAKPSPAPVAAASHGPRAQAKPPVAAKAKPDVASPEPSAPSAKSVASRVDGSGSAKTVSPKQEAEYRYQKAMPLIQAGRIAEAQETLQDALAADPSHGPARQLLASLLIDGKHGKEAEAVLRAGLERNPQQISLAMMLAHVQVNAGDLAGALSTLRQSLSYADDNASYHALYAALLQRNGQHQEAVDQYTAALGRQPASAPWLVGLGISLQAQNRMAEAHDAFARAKQLGTLGTDLSAFVDQRLKQTQRD